MAISNALQLTLHWRFQHGTIGANVLGWGITSGSPTVDQDFADEMAGLIASIYEAGLATLYPSTTFLTGMTLRNLAIDPNPVWPAFFGGEIQGGSAGDPVTNSLCVCITLRTPFGGRRGRGRVYLPGLSGTSYVDGNWNNTDEGADFLNDISPLVMPTAGATVTLGVISRADNALYGPATAVTRSEVPAVLRTRQDRP